MPSKLATKDGSSFSSPAMEYIIVRVKDQPNADAEVLINRKLNGRTGALLTLGSPGWIIVSVKLPGALEETVEIKNTTPKRPMSVTISCAPTPGNQPSV